MGDVAAYSVGTTSFALEPGRTATAMVAVATRQAMADAGLDQINALSGGPREVEEAILRHRSYGKILNREVRGEFWDVAGRKI